MGIALLALAGFNASCITPLTPYAIDFLLFLLTNQLYLTLIFWLLPKRRDGIYEKFTKKYIDTLIDNSPTHDAVLHAVIIGSSVTVGTLIEMSSNEKTTQIKIEGQKDVAKINAESNKVTVCVQGIVDLSKDLPNAQKSQLASELIGVVKTVTVPPHGFAAGPALELPNQGGETPIPLESHTEESEEREEANEKDNSDKQHGERWYERVRRGNK